MMMVQLCTENKLVEIAQYFNIKHYASVSNHIISLKHTFKDNIHLKNKTELIRCELLKIL